MKGWSDSRVFVLRTSEEMSVSGVKRSKRGAKLRLWMRVEGGFKALGHL
jgi:hypothetical protein